jgi:hypothetical protein
MKMANWIDAERVPADGGEVAGKRTSPPPFLAQGAEEAGT